MQMENIMKKIIKLLCIVLSVACLSFCVTSCSKDDYSYWQITAKQSGEARLVYACELSFGSSNIEVTEVWVNLSKFKAESTIITLLFAKTSTSIEATIECPITKSQVSESKDGWVQIYFGKAISCKIVTIEAVDTMRINEIYFVKSDGTSAKPTFNKGGVRVGSSGQLHSQSKLESLPETDLAYSEHPSFNVIDEQDKFPVEKIQTKK